MDAACDRVTGGSMYKPWWFAGLLALTVGAGSLAHAQPHPDPETKTAALQALSEQLTERDRGQRAAAMEKARAIGLPLRRSLPGGGLLELQRFDGGLHPRFYITNNVDAADTVSTDELWPGGSTGLNLTGNGMVVGEWDGGAIFNHPDLAGRLFQIDAPASVSGHSTHVAGTLIGNGTYLLPEARGMAYEADLHAYDWLSDTAEMAAAAASGMLMSNHSYGIAAGWIYIGGLPPDTWWWIGGSADTDIEDPYFGFYDAESALWDQIAVDAPYYLIVKAAGNDRSDTGPAPGEQYTIIDQDGQFVAYSTVSRPPDCAPAGYDCLPTNSVAKNVLTVGAVDDLPGGYSPLAGPGSVAMSPFSSWGPSDDGRIKPDLVGNGVFLLSTWHEEPLYAAAAGTSMAAPNVTGSLLLLQQHYEDLNGPGQFLRSASLKALAIHTADEAGDAPGPDYAFGWGLLNTRSASEVISGNGGDHQIVEGTLANGATDIVTFAVTEAEARLRATLVWHDPPGTPVPLSIDPPDLMLVNDLDLRVTRGGSTWFPWILDPANPSTAATTGDNVRDNVEQVVIDAATSGNYDIEISHKGALSGGGPQAYSLIISQEPPPPTGSNLPINETFSGAFPPPGWTVVTPQGIPWTGMDPVPGDPRLDNLSGGTGRFAMVDNNYAWQTVTHLRTPVLDLSANSGAVLRFQSYYYYDTFESINVDVSLDGGSSWGNVWQFQGFSPFPTQVVIDLSGVVAGEGAVMIRWRFDSEGFISGDQWQIDNVQLETFGGPPPPPPLPGAASNPAPADGALNQSIDVDLGWTAGSDTDSHDVYFGTSNPPAFQGNQGALGFDPGTLSHATTYFWRIDEVNAEGTTTGTVWSFSTEAAPPPPPSSAIHLAGASGAATPANKGRWTANATFTVHDDGTSPESGVTVSGAWSNGANGSGECQTDAAGSCTVSKANLKNNVASVTFTVTGLSKTGFTHDPADDLVSPEVVVGQQDTDAFPTAVNDSYEIGVDELLTGNVMDNDDHGDGPASIASNSTPAFGVLSLALDGQLSYTPNAGFEGEDAFSYSIIDQDGDVSATATVSITVSAAPPPPPPGALTLTASPYKVKGIQHVALAWDGFTSGQVDIYRDGGLISTEANSGSWDDNLGVKGGGITYVYDVCEAGTANCASASAAF